MSSNGMSFRPWKPARASAAAVLGLLLVSSSAAQEEEDDSLHGFSLHDTEGARAAQREAEEHLAAGRKLEALASLQELLDDHEGEVLGPTRPALPGSSENRPGARRSEQEVYPGGAQWATERLLELDPEVQALYREHHSEQALRALVAALESADRSRIVRVARRWPLTRESRRAWIALGDMEAEL